MDTLIKYRFIFFLIGLITFSTLQLIIPRRISFEGRIKYSISNIVTMGFNNLVSFILILIPLRASFLAENSDYGLFNNINFNSSFIIIFSIVILDIIIYFQHRLFHKVNFLWKLHSIHHEDPMLDTTTGFRFHPLEIIISNIIKIVVILLIGIPPISVLIFEIILNVTSMFNHSNFRITSKLEKLLRFILITPDLHLIHHSVLKNEMNSNYGFSVLWWDKIFKTYCDTPKTNYKIMKLGLSKMPDEKFILFPGLIIRPFKK